MKKQKIPTKKLTLNTDIPVLGIGTWSMGGLFFHDPTYNDKKDIKVIQKAIEKGITHIDTAEMYSAGHTEVVVGKAIQGYDRSQLFITTKLWPLHSKYDHVLFAAQNSLTRLNIPYIDLYLIHKRNYDVPLKETMNALDTLVDRGLIRFIGVSNFSLKEMKAAQSYSNYKIVNNQVQYNLLDREPEKTGLLEYCQKNGIILTAYQPLKRGILTRRGYPTLNSIADRYAKTPAQIAINWLIRKQNVITIPKTSRIDHLEEILKSIGWHLDEVDRKQLEKNILKEYLTQQ